jgi:catechol 2,3-dioxygenase
VAASIHSGTRPGPVSLTVRDLDRARGLYEKVVGLEELGREGPAVRLGTPDGRPLVELVSDPQAPLRPPRTTGLLHLAILVPDRAELARSLRRLANARWPLAGASDHLVSEALYLADGEGNGIEIYSDRPRKLWRRDGGEIEMATLPLDLQDLAGELDAADAELDTGLPDGTLIGHVHLNVADLAAAEAFYGDLLGLDVTARGYPGALFLSAGGYHHHIGLNTWRGEGAPPPPAGAAGLRAFELTLPDARALESAVERLRDGGVEVFGSERMATARDPSGNSVVLRAVG